MALIERLMGLNSDGSPGGTNPDQPAIATHTFFAACSEIVNDRATIQQVKNYFAMDAAAESEFDALIATGPSGTSALATAQKALYVEGIHAVFLLANEGVPTYATAAEVRAKLNLA